ncbi:MAG TPA: TetR/AcrR family transcriptional regulator [Candidatus Krumholzibacteria bacterium]|nr:TetR/AcrR family transcriptional regulator [Candidatus Krumholzibacteria bacterium]
MTGTVRKPTAERREEIARAALRIIGERGVTALTTTSLAAEIGVTTGALFRHFASREAILDEAVRFALARIEETFPDPALPPRERLLGLARNRARVFASDPGLAWLLRSEEAHLALPMDAVERLRVVVGRSKRYLLAAIRDGIAQGTIRGDIEPEVLLVPIMGTIHALIGMTGVHRQATRGRRPGTDQVVSALERMLAPPAQARAADKKSVTTRRLLSRR